MVDVHRIASGNVNCYIVTNKDKSILIDTGRKKYCEKDSLDVFEPTISMLYVDKQKMLASADYIGELGEKTIYFGHGKPKQNRKWVK